MARRSARLQKKRSPSPSDSSRDSASSGMIAESNATPQPERLPSVIEGHEPIMKTPQQGTSQQKTPQQKPPQQEMPQQKIPQQAIEQQQTPQQNAPQKSIPTPIEQPASQLPHTPSIGTPLRTKSSMSKLTSWAARTTPKNRTPIRPAGNEMHPAHHHATTAKVRDEARWLGFQAMDAHTAPPKVTVAGIVPGTPSKTPVPTSTSKISNFLASPDSRFRFRFRSPMADLTPKSSRILKEGHENDAIAGERSIFSADEFSSPADVNTQQRKTAVAKGKMARFSDVHMSQFKKMDSIANHPSAFRADPNRFKPVNTSVKRSPSKMDLDKPEPATRGTNKLKRTQSKIDLAEPAPKSPAMGLKRTQPKMDVAAPTTRILPPTPLKHTQSKMDMGPPNSNLPRASSTVRLVPPSRDGRPVTQDGPSAKRFKRIETDDAASTRPVSRDGPTQVQQPATPHRTLHSQTGLPRLASRLLTPTRASLARSQSAKTIKSTAMGSSLIRTPSANRLFSPTSIGQTMREGVREGIRKTSSSLQKVRSILRTPARKYSEDPEKVAAGTHMSPPPGLDMAAKSLSQAPATAPAKKHVNFTTSTLERINHDELGKSPSPMKLRAGSEVPNGAVIYPTLQTGVEYPALPNGDDSTSPSRRLTFGEATPNMPGKFSFKSDKPITFAPVTPGTIRMVRKSDASSLLDGKKRKIDTVEESSDKENNQPVEDEGRSVKKMRINPSETPKTPKSTSKLPRRAHEHGSSISKSRLAALSTPKRSRV